MSTTQRTISEIANDHWTSIAQRCNQAERDRDTFKAAWDIERKEADQLRADLERFIGHGLLDCHAICDQRDAAVQERDQLRARVVELEKDKERLDWAEQWGAFLTCHYVDEPRMRVLEGESLRAAIDAAKETKP